MVSPEFFRRYPFFKAAAERTLRELAMVSEVKSFASGEFLFRDMELAEHLFLLSNGEVDIRYQIQGEEHRTVDTRVAGDLLVWSALIHPYRATGSGVATRATEAVAIDAAKLRELCEKDRDLGYELFKEIAHVMSQRLQGARIQLATVD
jgi:CRP-like cAMP-binding protein